MLNLLKTIPGIISLLGVVLLIILPSVVGGGLATATDVTAVMRVFVSLIVLIAGLYVILSDKYQADTQKWAFGIVGLIVGYWLPALS